jgi:glycosyltransferase involved in cell wall biosynthesis
MPQLSVIIPTFNRAAMLPATIGSVRKAGEDLEIIVVDDGSVDDTAAACAREPDIKYIRLPRNSGTANARNVGIRESSADLVAFLDDDDLRMPDSFKKQIERLGAKPEAALVYGPALLGDSRYGLPTGGLWPQQCKRGDVYWGLLEQNMVPTCAVVARKECVERVGLFDTRLTTMEDYDLWIRLAEHFPFEAVDEPVAIYRRRSAGSGQKTSDRVRHEADRALLLSKMFAAPRTQAARRGQRQSARRKHMSIVYHSLVLDAAEALVDGDARSARSLLRGAIRFNPLQLRAHASMASLLCRNLIERLS